MLESDNDTTAQLLTRVIVTCYLLFKAVNNDPMFRRRCVVSSVCRVNVSNSDATQPTFYWEHFGNLWLYSSFLSIYACIPV